MLCYLHESIQAGCHCHCKYKQTESHFISFAALKVTAPIINAKKKEKGGQSYALALLEFEQEGIIAYEMFTVEY